jgi:putative transposase
MLEQHDIKISMDGKGRWIDNVFIERFWRGIKYEEVSLHAYEDQRAARAGMARYIDYDNREGTAVPTGEQLMKCMIRLAADKRSFL